MKTLTIISFLWIILAVTSFGRIGEDEKQIETRYGKAGKVLGDQGNVPFHSGCGFRSAEAIAEGRGQRTELTGQRLRLRTAAPTAPESNALAGFSGDWVNRPYLFKALER